VFTIGRTKLNWILTTSSYYFSLLLQHQEIQFNKTKSNKRNTIIELGNQSKRLLCINVSGPKVFNFVFNYQVVGNLIYLLTSIMSESLMS